MFNRKQRGITREEYANIEVLPIHKKLRDIYHFYIVASGYDPYRYHYKGNPDLWVSYISAPREKPIDIVANIYRQYLGKRNMSGVHIVLGNKDKELIAIYRVNGIKDDGNPFLEYMERKPANSSYVR